MLSDAKINEWQICPKILLPTALYRVVKKYFIDFLSEIFDYLARFKVTLVENLVKDVNVYLPTDWQNSFLDP